MKIANVFYAPHAHHLKTMIDSNRLVFNNFDCIDILYGVNQANSFQGDSQHEYISLHDSTVELYLTIVKNKADIVIFHGEFFRFFWFIIAGLFFQWNKIVWICWGAGTSVKTGIKGYFIRFVKRLVLPKLRAIIALADSDKCRLEERFMCKNVKLINYFHPFYQRFYERGRNQKASIAYRIQVGNDASSANHHEWCFQLLKNVENQNLQIICPFSYGDADQDYVDSVKKFAKIYLGNQVIFVDKFLEPNEFFELLLSIDALVIGSREQRALYSIFAFFAMGKPVFLPEDGELYRALSAQGFDILPIESISLFLQNRFTEIGYKVNTHNQKLILEITSINTIKAKWAEILGV